jgi:pyruvate,water dikinase
MSYIRWFQDINADEIDLVGGKGANLGEMARANFPVPPGYCVIAPAYQEIIEGAGLYPDIQKLLDRMDMADLADVSEKAAAIRELVYRQAIPETMMDEIVVGYRQLGREIGLGDTANTPVAIRSSATAEDLPTASFAGQQDTYLNIRGEEALLDHISRCWASLWTARAVTYRTKQGFDHQKVYVSVVVQAMINSEVSGILFTANPVNDNLDETVINASWGLGEAIVSGLVSPDTLTVKKDDGRIIRRQTADKELQIVYSDNGGTIELETSEEKRQAPVLSDRQAAELTALGVKIEKHYGRPQDIEWGLAGGNWYLLQARPITTLKPAEKVLDVDGQFRPGEYSRVMLVEIITEAVSPAFLSVLLPLVHSMFEFTFKTLGFKVPMNMDSVAGFYNQPYFHREYIEQAFSPLSPEVRRPLVEQLINPVSHEKQKSVRELSLPYVSMMARMIHFMVRLPKKLPGVLARYQEEINVLATAPLDGTSDQDIVANIRCLIFDTVSKLLNYDFLIITVTGRTYDILIDLLKPIYGDKTVDIVTKLNSGLDGNVTMATNTGIWDLSQEAKKSAVVVDVLRNVAPDQTKARLKETTEGREFLAQMDHFMKDFGHREIRFDIIYPTWSEDPTPVYGFLRSYLDAGDEQSPYLRQEKLIQERRELTKTVMAKLGQVNRGRLRSSFFRWMLSQSQTLTRERDTMHFEWTRLFPPTRRFLLELGRRWQERGMLEKQEDIFLMRLEEMEEMAVSPYIWDKATVRRAEFEAANARSWPEIIKDGREVFLKKDGLEDAPDGVLTGVSGSPGQVTGVSRIINRPEEFHKLKQGDILVAPFTNPVWTPLFAVAGGIVTEVGGILSHGAIVAREYGIPAVMSVPGATKMIAEGQEVTVDGDNGLVYLGEEAEA